MTLQGTKSIKAAARFVLERLEPRRMLAYQGVFNFAPFEAAAANGYLTDSGNGYGSQEGIYWGWTVTGNHNTGVQRTASTLDQRFKTYQTVAVGRIWEAQVPNGTYRVRIVAGSPDEFSASTYKFSAEGTSIVNGSPSSSNPFVTGVATITVSDGKLSISSDSGASNNRLAFIDIVDNSRLSSVPATPTDAAAVAASSTAVDFRWIDAADNEGLDPSPLNTALSGGNLGQINRGFAIERRTKTGSSTYTAWAQIGTSFANAELYTDTTAASNTTYQYRVKATNVAGSSASYAATSDIATPADNTQKAYNGSNSGWSVPGIIQAEDFDRGGEDVSYNDTQAGNAGGWYRSGNVDIAKLRETNGSLTTPRGYKVGWTRPGEWTEYTVNVPTAGTYLLSFRMARKNGTGTFHAEFGGVDKTGSLTIPDTTNFNTYVEIQKLVQLSAGTQVMKVVLDTTSVGYSVCDFDRIALDRFDAPSNLAVPQFSDSSFTLAWQDNSSIEDSFEIWAQHDGSYEKLAIASSGSTSALLSGLDFGTRYRLQVKAVAGGQSSAFSLRYEATTLEVRAEGVGNDDLVTGGGIDLVLSGIDASRELSGAVLLSNSNYDEGNLDSNNAPVPDTEPDFIAGDRISDTDSELLDAWLSIKGTGGTGAMWKLDFLSNVKVWLPSGGTWVPLSSGTWMAAGAFDAVIPLKIEGVQPSAAPSGSPITASFNDGTSVTQVDEATVTVVPLNAPTPQSLSASLTSTGAVQITWAMSATAGLKAFGLHRSGNGVDFDLVTSTLDPTATSFDDANVPFGTTIYYKLVAIDAMGRESTAATTQINVATDSVAPLGVTALSGSSDGYGIDLTWQGSTSQDIDGYEIYRSGDLVGVTDPIVRLGKETSFYDAGIANFGSATYTIYAVDIAGNKSGGVSVTVSTGGVDRIGPLKPSGFTVTRDSNGVYTIDWGDNSELDLDGYIVYRSSDLSGDYAMISDGIIYTSQFVDDSVEASAVAYYKVSAIDRMRNESRAINADVVAPTAPTGLSIVLATGGLQLSWTQSPSVDVNAYRICRANDIAGPYIIIDGLDDSANSYFDTSVPPGATVYYRVCAIDTSGNISSSATDSSSLPLSQAVVDGLEGAAASGTQVNLRWDEGWSIPVTWEVHRSTSSGFTPSVSNRIAMGLIDNYFADTTVSAGTIYYYKVIARGEDGTQTSQASGELSVSTSAIAVPLAPNWMFGENAGNNAALWWSSSVLNALSYRLERWNASTSVWQLVANVPYSEINYLTLNPVAGSSQQYRIRAENSAGNGTYVSTTVEAI